MGRQPLGMGDRVQEGGMIMALDQSQQSAVDHISRLTSPVYLLIGAGGSGDRNTCLKLQLQGEEV